MYELTGYDREQPKHERPRRVLIARADNETEAEKIKREEQQRYGDIQRVRIA